jgi:hypothetical protein
MKQGPLYAVMMLIAAAAIAVGAQGAPQGAGQAGGQGGAPVKAEDAGPWLPSPAAAAETVSRRPDRTRQTHPPDSRSSCSRRLTSTAIPCVVTGLVAVAMTAAGRADLVTEARVGWYRPGCARSDAGRRRQGSRPGPGA